MINKKNVKGSKAPKMMKKKNKLGKEKTLTEKKTFFSKEKGSVFKQSAWETSSSKSMSNAPISPKVNSEKVLSFPKDHSTTKRKARKMKSGEKQPYIGSEQAQAKQIKKKHGISTNGNTKKDNHKRMKRKIDMDSARPVPVVRQSEGETEVLQIATKNGTTKGKKKKKRKLASGVGSTGAPEPVAGGSSGSGQPARLSVAGGFSWETSSWPQVAPQAARPGGDDSSDDDDDTQQQPAARLSRQQLRERAAAEERQLVERERRLMDPSRAPETADDHERLVVAHPDDSSLWIRFMSHFLQATEIEKARGVARRALKTINFREEDEKLNVYVAWLNLESMHGTQETLGNVLHEALQYNDTFKVYTRMAEIHQANSRHDEAELMYSQLVKKLPARKEAWLRYGVFLMQVERQEAARALMQRAIKCLDRRDHVEVISKFAQLEFRFGEPERGKTMFDHLLATYPKRLDQWNVYLGQLIKSADYDSARLIFQRAATVRLNARRARSLLKRFLEFEEAHGTAEQQQAVKELARQYVEARSEAEAAALDQQVR